MNEQQRKEFSDLSDKLIKWLNDNGHPHMTIIVTPTNAELVEGIASHHTEEHLRD